MTIDSSVGLFTYAESVTPADTDLSQSFGALYVGAGGNLRVTTIKGQDVTFIGVLGGTFFPGRVKRVSLTGTTAGDIIGLR